MSEIIFSPIGYVRNSVKDKKRHGWSEVESVLSIDARVAGLMEGLEGFSHLIVIFWMNRNEGDFPVRVHPRGRKDLPLTGVFATRAPHRPNSIGMSVVRLLGREGTDLKVLGLDAFDGTPVLDIKPYLPGDCVPGASYPDWVATLDRA